MVETIICDNVTDYVWELTSWMLVTAEPGGAAEEAGSGRGLCVCWCAESPEHLQQTLLQVNIDALLHIRSVGTLRRLPRKLTQLRLCLLPQHSEGRFPQHIIQAAGETGMSLKMMWRVVVNESCEVVLELYSVADTDTDDFFHPSGGWWC